MLTLPQTNWTSTIRGLHQVAMLLAPIHRALLPKRPNWLHLPLHVQPTGLLSQALPNGGRILIDFKAGFVNYQRNNGIQASFAFASHSQASLMHEILAALQHDELEHILGDANDEALLSTLLRHVHTHEGLASPLNADEFSHEEPLAIDPDVANAYANVLYSVFTGVARYRARLNGHLSPVVVWPEHFDLSTLWFASGAMDENQAHINIGFAPYSPGYERPYLYAYAYPYPQDFVPPAVPSPAFWNADGWRGVVVPYDDMANQNEVTAYVEQMCMALFGILREVLET